MLKKLSKFIMSLAMVFTLLPITALSVSAEDDYVILTINEATVPDDNFRSYLEGFDTDGDGQLMRNSEFGEYNYQLYLSNKGIKDLTGIENFTFITYLDCSNNELTDLNLSALTELSSLNCNYNNLTELDVSQNPALSYLYCEHNKIKNIELGGSDASLRLYAGWNLISSLDVSGTSNIQTIDLNSNQVTGIDVSVCSDLRNLSLSFNPVTSVDVTNCPEMYNLELIGCKLSTIDLSNCNRIEYLNLGHNNLVCATVSNTNSKGGNPLNSVYGLEANRRHITLNGSNQYDLSELVADGFDISKASDWQGGSVEGTTLTFDSGVTQVSYLYDCGNSSHRFYLYTGDDSTSTTGNIEINETNFPDATFRNYISTYIDDGDGVLSASEIENTIEINVEGSSQSDDGGITSLQGIKYFTNLYSLNCNYNKSLTSLDLSENTQLTYLNCYYDTSLASLNIDNTDLALLHANNCALTSLDISNCPSLAYIDFSSNKLSTFTDGAKNCTLAYLGLSRNNLSAIDTSVLTGLKDLIINNNYSYRSSMNLDLSNCLDLEEIQAWSCNITSLDLSKNTKLETLQIYGCPLGTLDLTYNTELKILDCHGCDLTELNIDNCTKLTSLDCSDNYLEDIDISNFSGLDDQYSFDGSSNGIKSIKLESNTFDLSTVKNLDLSKTSGWEARYWGTDGKLYTIAEADFKKGSVLDFSKMDATSIDVYYTYDCNPNSTETWTKEKWMIKVTKTASEAKAQTITGPSASYTKVYGNAAFSLNAKASTSLTYKSSNTSVATVSSAGKVTIKGVGKATITITAAATSSYKSATKKVTITVKPKATSISSLTKASKAFTVKWAKVSTQCTGYQIQYSTSSKFTSAKTVTVTSYKTTSKKISSLKSKKKYYVRVRTYKTVSGTKYYSSWSTAKNVTTK